MVYTTKYKKIVKTKIDKYGFCNTILIEKVGENDSAILIQNAFPTLEKYIDHVHIVDGVSYKIGSPLKEKILQSFRDLMGLKNRGKNLFFADIDKIKNMMLKELENDKINSKK